MRMNHYVEHILSYMRCFVYEVTGAGCVVQFRIVLPPIVRNQWFDLATKLNIISLNEVKNEVRWKWAGAENS
jgi:hypothetical protein